MSGGGLRFVRPEEVPALRRGPLRAEALAAAAPIVEDVRARGAAALHEHALRFGDLRPGEPLVRTRAELRAALAALPRSEQALLERTADRIRLFAQAQRAALHELEVAIPGGAAGHTIAPVEIAGCYAPGGRFPLPSSVLMTVVTARAAGVATVWVASPKPAPVTLAAAAVAGADALLAAGGAQAIAALAYGAGVVPACDAVVGPGNRFVTAAKQLVAGRVAVDRLAGPTELVVFADASADPELVAADLLAQAEHDPEAFPVLVTTEPSLAHSVNLALERQLGVLPTASVAAAALANGFAVLVPDLEAGIAICDLLAPEHLELHLRAASALAPRFKHYGALFVGSAAAEVLADYGAGPNHTLPTGGTARSAGGLSVFDFLRVRTWLRIDDPGAARALLEDALALGELEGLPGHVQSAKRRLGQ